MTKKLKSRHLRWAVLLRVVERERCLDVLNRDAVDDYAQATGATVVVMPYGADKCRLMGRDLSAMKTAGLLKRSRTGLQNMAGMGFPRWVWSYETTNAGRDWMASESSAKVDDEEEIEE